MKGTHLYIMYEGHGYSIASLYCLGFLSGAVTSPYHRQDWWSRKNGSSPRPLSKRSIWCDQRHTCFPQWSEWI